MGVLNSWVDLLEDVEFMMEYLNGPVCDVRGMCQPMRESISIGAVGIEGKHTFGVRRHKYVEAIFNKVLTWLPANECSRLQGRRRLAR